MNDLVLEPTWHLISAVIKKYLVEIIQKQAQSRFGNQGFQILAEYLVFDYFLVLCSAVAYRSCCDLNQVAHVFAYVVFSLLQHFSSMGIAVSYAMRC